MFKLHPRLEADTFPIGELDLCKILLMNNAFYPWLILVPKKPDLKEIIDLNKNDRAILMEEISLISEKMQSIFAPDKLNVAALGNQVPQLHIHIIARYKEDRAWPNPVWGGASHAYDDELKNMMMERLLPIINT